MRILHIGLGFNSKVQLELLVEGGKVQRDHGQTIRHEWMYHYNYSDQQVEGRSLPRPAVSENAAEALWPLSSPGADSRQVSIYQRWAVVTTRQRFADWEGDTVIRKGHRGIVVTLVGPRSKYIVLEGVQHKTAAAGRKVVARGLRPHQARVHMMT